MSKKIVFVALAAMALVATSCQEKLKTTSGVVKTIKDSVMVAHIDKYDITFETSKARFDNGALMEGDSVVIHYIGDLREKKARALLLRLVPKKGTVVEAVYDPSKELIVGEKPLSEEQVKKLEKFSKSK